MSKSSCKASYTTINGWTALTVENEFIAVTTLPEYGGWIYSVFNKKRQIEMLWQCPRGLRSKDDPVLVTEPLRGYHARTLGAWPEIFPHGSSPVEINGIMMPMHGEAVQRAWDHEIVCESGEEAVVRMKVRCHLLPLTLERVLRARAGQAILTLEEAVTNYGGVPADFMWGHHPLFGKPLYNEGSRIIVPAKRWLREKDFKPTPWPVSDGQDFSVCPAEGAGVGGMYYFDGLEAGWVALVNPSENFGAALSWDHKVFPYVWIWREANSSKAYPYFGTAYAVALEPFSHLPGARQRGEKLLYLDPGATLKTSLNLTLFEDRSTVNNVTREGKVE